MKTWHDLYPNPNEPDGRTQGINDDGSWAGIGTEVIRIRFEDTRLLGQLPEEVEVVATLRPPAEHDLGPGWIHDPTFYLQIRHRYCVRVEEGCSLMIDYIQSFLHRYAELRKIEEQRTAEVMQANL